MNLVGSSALTGFSPSPGGDSWSLGTRPGSAALSAGTGIGLHAWGARARLLAISDETRFPWTFREVVTAARWVQGTLLTGARSRFHGRGTRLRTPTIATDPIPVMSWTAAVTAARRVRLHVSHHYHDVADRYQQEAGPRPPAAARYRR